MNASIYFLGAMHCAQVPAAPSVSPYGAPASIPSLPAASAPVPVAPADTAAPVTATPVSNFIAPEDVQDNSGIALNFAPPVGYAPPPDPILETTRGLFESDHAFDGFTTPLSNPVQSKDPRSLTEARFLFMGNWSRPSTPVIGGGAFQVYALQLRLAVTDRLQLFADKDGLVRFSPKGASSVFALANIMAGAKYVLIRDVENQFLFSGVVQYEASTGYHNIFEGHGDGLLGVYGVPGKEFWDNWHFVSTFGQNIALNNSNSGYFMVTAHIDRRFGKFVPFYEANWFYYNQSGRNVPGVGIEGGGWLNLGASKVMGLNYLTNAIGFNYEFSQHLIFGVAYEYQLTSRTMLMNKMLNAQLIFPY